MSGIFYALNYKNLSITNRLSKKCDWLGTLNTSGNGSEVNVSVAISGQKYEVYGSAKLGESTINLG